MPSFPSNTLSTERLRLRHLVRADRADLFAIFSDSRVMRYWSSPPWIHPSQAAKVIAADQVAMRDGHRLRLGLEYQGTVIGTCSLFDLHWSSGRAEIGYALNHHYWGHGLMQEALTALVNYAFETLGLRRLEADIDPRNRASARSLERLGFVREGLLRERWLVAGEVTDSVVYGLLRREWSQGCQAAQASA